MLSRSTHSSSSAFRFCSRHLLFYRCLFRLGPGIVVGQLNADFASIFTPAIETMPGITLSTTRRQYAFQANPGFSNQFRLLVVVENRHLEIMIIGRIVNLEAQFLVPVEMVRIKYFCSKPRLDLPSRSLPASLICCRLFRFLPEPGGAIRILFAHGSPIGQVLRSVDNGY